MMEINREQTPGKMKIRVGAPGKGRDTYSALNIMANTAECIAGNMIEKQALGEMARIQGEIPDPTVGYLRGSSIECRRMGNELLN